MSNGEMIELETVQDTDKIRYILDEGAESVGSDGEFSVTPDQFNEILDRSDEILSALDSAEATDSSYFDDLLGRTEEYIDQIPYRNPEAVVDESHRLSEKVNTARSIDVNAAGLVYGASLLTNERKLENGDKVTQNFVAETAGVSTHSVRQSYEDMIENI